MGCANTGSSAVHRGYQLLAHVLRQHQMTSIMPWPCRMWCCRSGRCSQSSDNTWKKTRHSQPAQALGTTHVQVQQLVTEHAKELAKVDHACGACKF